MGKNAEKLIHEYWVKDAERKLIESKMVKHDQNHMNEHGMLVKNKLEEIGATDLMLIAEKSEVPKLTFKLNGNTYTTDCIYDFTYDIIMNNVYEKLKQ
jgi:hypothetical protein